MTADRKDLLERIVETDGCCRLFELSCTNCPLYLELGCCHGDGARRREWAMEELAKEVVDKLLMGRG